MKDFGISVPVSWPLDEFDILGTTQDMLRDMQRAVLEDMTAQTWCNASHEKLSNTCYHCSWMRRHFEMWSGIVYALDVCDDCTLARYECTCPPVCCDCGCCD